MGSVFGRLMLPSAMASAILCQKSPRFILLDPNRPDIASLSCSIVLRLLSIEALLLSTLCFSAARCLPSGSAKSL